MTKQEIKRINDLERRVGLLEDFIRYILREVGEEMGDEGLVIAHPEMARAPVPAENPGIVFPKATAPHGKDVPDPLEVMYR